MKGVKYRAKRAYGSRMGEGAKGRKGKARSSEIGQPLLRGGLACRIKNHPLLSYTKKYTFIIRCTLFSCVFRCETSLCGLLIEALGRPIRLAFDKPRTRRPRLAWRCQRLARLPPSPHPP